MTVIDSIVRLIPGVLGGAESAIIESFSDGETLEWMEKRAARLWELQIDTVLARLAVLHVLSSSRHLI